MGSPGDRGAHLSIWRPLQDADMAERQASETTE